MTPSELIERLKSFDQESIIAYDIWQVEDVESQAPNLTYEQCENVINAMEQHKDATIGLNWEVMDVHISNEEQND